MKQKDTGPEFFVGQTSHAGYERLLNEDECGCFSTLAGEILVVAGGGQAPDISGDEEAMAESQAGSGVASRLAVSTIHNYIKDADESESPEKLLTQAILAADAAVAKAGAKFDELRGVGSTLAVLLLRDNEAWFAQLGGGGLYLLTGGIFYDLALSPANTTDIVPKTKDLAPVPVDMPLVDGPIQDQAPVSEDIRATGSPLGRGLCAEDIRVGYHQCRREDLFLLGTETLARLVTPLNMDSILKMPIPTSEKSRKLIEEAVKNNGGDNVSTQVLSFIDYPELAEPKAFGFKPAVGFCLGLGVGFILGGVTLSLWHFLGRG